MKVGKTDILRTLSSILERWAEPGYLPDADANGVRVQIQRDDPERAKLDFVTVDDCHVAVYFDFRQTSRQYIEDMVAGLKESLDEHRKDRKLRETPLIITPGGA